MKKIALLFILTFHIGFAQEILPIKGRIVSEVTSLRPLGDIDIYLEDATPVEADENGEFFILPKKKQDRYILTIHAGFHKTLTYEYKSEWSTRKHPKSIVVYSNIKASKEIARSNFKKGQLQLYIQGGIAPVMNSKKDDRFERKYQVIYYELECGGKTEEAILEYNKMAFFLLDLKHGKAWRSKAREDVVGL